MPRLRVGSIRPEMIYAGSTNVFKVYNGSQWSWTQDANFDAGSIVYTGQDMVVGIGIPVSSVEVPQIQYAGQVVSIKGTYTFVDYGTIIYTGQEVKLPVTKFEPQTITYTGQDVEIPGSAFSSGFSEGFVI